MKVSPSEGTLPPSLIAHMRAAEATTEEAAGSTFDATAVCA
jgi:hypothetical protein